MKKQTETEGIISIDLDEEKAKEEKQQQIEITAGDMYMRIPADRSRIKEAIAFLQVFEQQLPRQAQLLHPTLVQQPILPTLPEINREIQNTKQFLAETEQQQAQIEQKLNLPNQPMSIQTPSFPQQTIPQEDTTILDQHKTYERCPKCSGKLKKKKIEMGSDGMKQTIVCKNRRCRWSHTYLIRM